VCILVSVTRGRFTALPVVPSGWCLSVWATAKRCCLTEDKWRTAFAKRTLSGSLPIWTTAKLAFLQTSITGHSHRHTDMNEPYKLQTYKIKPDDDNIDEQIDAKIMLLTF